jgi:nicotinamidase-related amidase
LVIVFGHVAEFCVLSTVRGTLERGYRSPILEDAIADLAELTTRIKNGK